MNEVNQDIDCAHDTARDDTSDINSDSTDSDAMVPGNNVRGVSNCRADNESQTTKLDLHELAKAHHITESKIDEKATNLTISNKLRFGIEAILKVTSDVKGKLRDKKCYTSCEKSNAQTVNIHTLAYDQGRLEVDATDETDYESSDDLMNGDDNIGDITEACLPYVRLPASLQALHTNESAFRSSQNLFSAGGINIPWSSSILHDIRKERFGPIRRIGHPYQNRTPPKRKKPRTSFTRLQILELEKRFERQKYLASTERSSLAKSLKMSDAQVKTWFQNRRTKWRRQTAEERELERQAANRLLLSFHPESVHRKSMVMSADRLCLSHLQRIQDKRATDV